MNTAATARHGATPVRLTFGNWIALVGVLATFALPLGGYAISLGYSVQAAQEQGQRNQKDVERVIGRLDEIANGLTQLVRLDERISGIEQRLGRMEAKLDAR